ncbi:hypothetical protein A2W14_00125 [Candidatus Gottesmanbacteria bacterium RBG_16_37_8]|uniref:O-antigen ligase-related domain-containing protein n=1 Tax=Candidatus Gottesmanbacteria bacterium RBG_16_37_8 TaxID=1798371 RepID=A0A1F5YSF1_9BACT|nr:MAG: hypothetical protein A2W14_00125 [Candidatus Gottesmanbacteria bacterium RBG_16_37_8]
MKKIIRNLIALILFSSVLGPAAKLPLGIEPVNIYLSDLLVAALVIVLLVNLKKIIPLIKNDQPLKYFFIFVIFAFISLLFNPLNLSLSEFFISSLYLFRYLSYFGIYIAVLYLFRTEKKLKNTFLNYLNISGISLLILGWLQYLLYPDLRNLSYLGWDPHYKRIFALIFDPNYLGLLLIFYLQIRFIHFRHNLKEVLLRIINLITIAFTYSRSTYLALFSSAFYLACFSKKLVLYLIISLFLSLSLFFLPRPGGEGVKLERFFSVRERLSNWQSAGQLIKQNPLLGVGFNSLRYARKKYQLLPENWLTSHSAAGIDNSFLFILATTGVIGLAVYLYFLAVLFKKSAVLGRSAIIAAVVHSFFLNSLFFSFILIWLWVICAVSQSKKIRESN